jgi:hypothetical protein
MQRDMKQILHINDEFNLQAAHFRDRELQFNDLTKEYRAKLEQIKFEREQLAMKEE